ncbi:MAG: heparinase II/III-family protein [Phycisphaerales bacterium]|nr:heparinase II/III-family protein [Phycisphaerales bacterium]
MATTTSSTKTTLSQKCDAFDANRRPISKEHPRLFGSREQMRKLATERPEAYRRMVDYARNVPEEAWVQANGYELQAKMLGLGVAYALGEASKQEGRMVVDLVLKNFVDQPIKSGHVTFGYDLAKCAIAYDLCHDLWMPEERERFRKYVHATIDANHDSETSPFHNGWYGYKHWGYGLAGYALMHDDPEAQTILKNLERDYLEIAVPALKLAGGGGGWAEGYYIHYWLFDWMWFCEVARTVEGLDYYAPAPEFYQQRPIAAMFEFFPPLMQPTSVPAVNGMPSVTASELSRRPIPMGDGGGKYAKHERDKDLTTRRIIVGLHRNDPVCQAVHAYNLQTPRPAIACDAFMDFFWNDTTVKAGDLDAFKLSHWSPAAGYVYARSSWKDDASHFFFKCGRQFTAHQHLDNGHFMIFKHDELLGDGGHYAGWTESHIINYYVRTIAHNSLLIEDPSETWAVRGFPARPAENDGGQLYPYRPDTGVNAGVLDAPAWHKNRDLMDRGQITAYQDRGSYLYTAGDFTKSYSPKKAKCVTRQIVYIRPGTFVIFDRVESTNPTFKKKFVLQPMSVPEKHGEHWVVTQGKGRLFVQTLSPTATAVELFHGENLYSYGGKQFPQTHDFNRAPDCRMEVTATTPATFDYFLHVLTATDATVNIAPSANAKREGNEMVVQVEGTTIRFTLDRVGGKITIGGKDETL